MDCGNYGNTVGIVTAIYNRLNGELFVETLLNHGLSITDDVKVAGLQFSCNSGISTYPDGDDASLNIYPVDAILSPTSFIINVGVSTVNHTYEGGGDVFVFVGRSRETRPRFPRVTGKLDRNGWQNSLQRT